MSQRKGGLVIGPRLLAQKPTGVAVALEALIDEFERLGEPVRVVNTEPRARNAETGSFSWGRAADVLRALATYIRLSPKVEWVYFTLSSSRIGFIKDFVVIWVGVIQGGRTVSHLHGGGYGEFLARQPSWLQWLVRRTLSKCGKVIVLSENLRSQFDFISKDKIEVIPNGLLDESLLSASYSSPRERIEKRPAIRIVFLSNLIVSKGVMDLIEACRILNEKNPGVLECNLCGAFVRTVEDENSLDRPKLDRLLREWNLENVVTYQGVVSGRRKAQILDGSTVLVLPTFYPWEGQPLCIIEAFSMGVPVIATAHKGIAEQVVDGENGVFVSPHSPTEIADALIWMHGDPYRYVRLGENARKDFGRRFSRQRHLSMLTRCIRDAK